MTNAEASTLWVLSAEEAYRTAEDTYENHPNWAFFSGIWLSKNY
jgi:hypothetical protein